MESQTMRFECIDPKQVVMNLNCQLDRRYRDAIRDNGFGDEEYPAVRERGDGQYDLLRGQKQLIAILSLIAEDEICNDFRTAERVEASKLFRSLPVCVFVKE